MEIRKSKEFDSWFSGLSVDYKKAIYSRFYKIEKDYHFGDVKSLKQGLYELRWRNGVRLYFYRSGKESIFILLGGLKNAQEKDIKKARILLRRHADSRTK